MSEPIVILKLISITLKIITITLISVLLVKMYRGGV